jgi:hypothetical protein
MKENWKPIAIALGIFVTGLLTGVWSQRIRIGPPPQPGIGVMGEFAHEDFMVSGAPAPPMVFEKALEPPRPEVSAYEEKLDKLIATYRERMRALLKPDQLEAFDRLAAPARNLPTLPPPLMPMPPFAGARGHDFIYVRTGPGGGELRFVGLIIYRPFLDLLTHELKLDEEQRAALAKIMEERRTELLKFVDATPPPTVQIRLAPEPSTQQSPG